jgi:hypothetical protein
MAAAYSMVKKEPAAVTVTLKKKLVHMMIAN